ncbi:hypothetical protein JCM10213_000593 [Rhodosporidiobolus nylandii]
MSAPPLPSTPSPAAPAAGGDRSALVASAVSFLRDPSASSSPLTQRIAFLESKGLTQAEIQHALSTASLSDGAAGVRGYPPAGYGAYGGYGGQRNEYEKDWRDWFVMGVVGGGVAWLGVKLAQKFLLPSLRPPSETDLEASQRALEAKYDEAALLLNTLQESTDAVAASLDEQKSSVEKELDEVRKAVADMREGERKRDEWARKVEEQVADMARSLPSLLDKQSTSTATSLSDLQTELKSLKSLLIARRPPPSFSPSSSPSITPSTSASSLPFSIKPPGLPAWQLKGSSAAPAAAPAATSPGGSVGGYVVPSGADDKDQQKEPEKRDEVSQSGVLVEKPKEEEGKKEGEEGAEGK